MPLPNMPNNPAGGGPRVTAGETYAPNTAAMSQMGASVNDVRKLQDQNQAISKLLDNISARLSNISNVRSNVQSATFESFGNNFISRGMNQLVSGITDSLSEIMGPPPDKEKEDPMVTAIKKQTEILGNVAESTHKQLEYSAKTSLMITDQTASVKSLIKIGFGTNGLLSDQVKTSKEILKLTETPRAVELMAAEAEKQRLELQKVDGSLKTIINVLESAVKTFSSRKRGPVQNGPRASKLTDVTPLTPNPNAGTSLAPLTPHLWEKASPFSGKESATDVPFRESPKEAFSNKPQEEIPPEEAPFAKQSRKGGRPNPAVEILAKMGHDIEASKGLLKSLVDIQTECCQNLAKMTHVSDAVKAESQQAASRKLEEEAVHGVPKVVVPPPNEPAMKTGFTAGFKDFFKSMRAPAMDIAAAAAPETSTSTDEGSGIVGDAAAAAAAAALAKKSIPKAATPVVKAGASRFAGMAKGLAGGGLAALAGEGIQMGGEALKESGYTETGKAVGVGGTALKYAGYGAMAGSLIPGVGTLVGAGVGGAIGAGKGIYDQYFSDQAGKDSANNLSEIEKTNRELAKSRSTTNKESEAPVVVTNSTVNNQTIFPTRTIVKNTDDSFNRYLSSVLGIPA